MHNLSEAVQKVVGRHRRCLQPPAPEPVAGPPGPSAAMGRRVTNTRQRHAAVHTLLAQGLAIKAIARQLQLDRKTVRKYARAANPEQLLGPSPSSGPGRLRPFKPYLQARCDEGVTATSVLLEEIRARGYRGGERTLRRFLVQVRGHEQPPAPPPVPSAREITAWIMRPEDKLNDDDRTGLKNACTGCIDLAALTDLAHGFNELVRQRGGDRLETWINHAARCAFPEVRAFVTCRVPKPAHRG